MRKLLHKFKNIFNWIKINNNKILFTMSIIAIILSIVAIMTTIERATHIPSQMVLAEISFIKAGRPIPFESQIDL